MSLKRWISVAAVVALLMTGMVGCGKRPAVEEGAATNEYVESDQQSGEQDLPEIVGDPTVTTDPNAPVQNTPVEDPADEPEEEPADTPVENTPSEETPPQPEETPPEEETKPENSVSMDPSSKDWWSGDQQQSSSGSGEGSEDSGSEGEEEETETIDPNQLKIVSYNVRCADDADGNSIAERAPRFQTVMEKYDPDIMGLQEVVPKWLPYLNDYFNAEYDSINKWRAVNNKEATPIYWKRDKFSVLDEGYFWLSETPDEESKAVEWGADHYRTVLWVKLRVKATGKDFIFMNTHFDYKNETCHVNSAKLVIERAVALGGFSEYPVFCTGDFNMNPDKKGYKEMYKKFADTNRELANDKTPTSNGYNKGGGSIIDYCFYSPTLATPLKYQVLNEKVNGGYVSDHRGVYAELKLS